MFWEISIERLIVLQPQHLYTDQISFTTVLLTQLVEEVNNMKCSEDHGFYITPTTVEKVDQGRVRSITGAVAFPIRFKCIVFKPFRKEILQGAVKKIYRSGCFLSCGPLDEVFLHEGQMNGCCYVQNESMESACFKNEQEGFEIRAGSTLRVRLIGLKWVEEERNFRALASINGNFLGCVDEGMMGC